MADEHVRADVERYNRIERTSASPFTGSTTVRFLRYAFFDSNSPTAGSISVYDHSFPAAGSNLAPRPIPWMALNDPNVPMSSLIDLPCVSRIS